MLGVRVGSLSPGFNSVSFEISKIRLPILSMAWEVSPKRLSVQHSTTVSMFEYTALQK